MQFFNSIFTKIKAALASLTQVAAPASTITAPHIRALLLHLCNQDAEQATWVARWLAYPLRHPGAKMQTALLVDGVQGAGGSLFFEQIIAPMYGHHARCASISSILSLHKWGAGKRYVVFHDADSQHIYAHGVKELLTTRYLPFTRATRTVTDRIPNELNMVFMSNKWGNRDYHDTRRIFVLSPKTALPVALATAAIHEIENGGLVEFNHYLTHELDMSSFHENTSTSYLGMEVAA